MIRIVVIDDHTIVRDGLVQLLGSHADLEVVGAAGDGAAAVALCLVEATRQIVAQAPGTQVVVLTSFMDRDRIVAALGAGAIGYLLKDAEPEELIRGIRSAARGESPLDPRAARTMLSAQRTPGPLDALTEREREVLALVAEGLPNKQIARRLEISLTSVFRAIGVNDRMQAGLWARRNGL